MALFVGSTIWPFWYGPPPSAFHNGQLKENAPMSMEQARAAITAATDITALPAIQLRSLSPETDLPPHTALSNESSTLSAARLAAVVLNQSLAFIDGVYPAFSIQENYAKSKGSTATVTTRILERGKEKWVGRNSKHSNQGAAGTATWEQFNEGLRIAHNRHQLEYSDDIEDAHQVCDWSVDGVEGWKDITIEVFEMLQKESFMSKPRSYSVLVVSASLVDSSQFIVAQLPVDLSAAAGARYANGKNTSDITANSSSTMGKKTVVTERISIDRVKLESDPKSPDAEPKVLWELATCSSNGKGTISSSIGKPIVARDVGAFIEWVNRN